MSLSVHLLGLESSSMLARLRLRIDGLPQGVAVTGRVRGPFCDAAQTLYADFPLRMLSTAGDTLEAEARIADPCYWTPELPHRYQVRITSRLPDGTEVQGETLLGVRQFQVKSRGLYLCGKRTVLRGAWDRGPTARMPSGVIQPAEHDLDDPLRAWRKAGLVRVCHAPSDLLCEAASRIGVLLIARLDGTPEHVAAEIGRLARHAAVGVIVLPPQWPSQFDPRRLAPATLFARALAADAATDAVSYSSCGISLGCCELNEADLGAPALQDTLPQLAEKLPLLVCVRPEKVRVDNDASNWLREAREQCDALQARLPPSLRYIGYIA